MIKSYLLIIMLHATFTFLLRCNNINSIYYWLFVWDELSFNLHFLNILCVIPKFYYWSVIYICLHNKCKFYVLEKESSHFQYLLINNQSRSLIFYLTFIELFLFQLPNIFIFATFSYFKLLKIYSIYTIYEILNSYSD